MPEQKKKKLRLYKFASEYNLSTDSLVEYLQEKGHDVKSHMALLTDEMVADIHSKYKKDMEKAETHYRKVTEFHKKRIEKRTESQDSDEEEVQSAVEVSEPVQEESASPLRDYLNQTADEEEDFEPVEVQAEEEKNSNEPVEEAQEPVVEEPVAKEEPVIEEKVVEKEPEEVQPVTNKQPVTPEVTKEEPVEEMIKPENGKPFKTQTEIDLDNSKQGLTILGKIDLEDKKKSRKQQRNNNNNNTSNNGNNKNRKQDNRPSNDRNAAAKDKPVEENKNKPANNQPASSDNQQGKKKWKKKKGKGEGSEQPEQNVDNKSTAKNRKKKKGKRVEVDQNAVDAAIRQTMLGMDATTQSGADRASMRKKKRKEKLEQEEIRLEQEMLEKAKLKVTEFIAVSEIANLMNVNVGDVIAKCMGLGLMVSINQRLDVETITLVADEFGYEVEFQEEYTSEALDEVEEENEEDLALRPPVVTIMGHVDHGKTSLLDYVRRANVVAGEAGGITQHIGAYKVKLDNGKEIAFLDTPGHEAFTAMRARGASVTDIVILIVAADDAVMPQTVEAINHALAANVPIVVAINKVDKPGANIEKIKQQLAERNVLVEDWGGKYQCCEISAKFGDGVDVLLEKLLLEAEMLEAKANPDRMARGTVIESQLDKGRGVTSTILIQKGTLRVGDPFVAGIYHGRVRAMFDERNNKVTEAGPSTPVLVLGFEGAPQAGDSFVVLESEREVREVAIKRQQLKREQDHRQVNLITLDQIAAQAGKGAIKELPIIVKGDVDGSVEALADSLMKLTTEEVTVKVIHKGVGAISEGDVILAQASNAIIVGFHVRPHTNARKLAEKEKVDIRLYNVIYDTINEIKSALEGMLDPILSEKLVGTIEIRDTFKVPKVGTVAGCYVQDGNVNRNNKIRLFRDGIVIYEGELATLKRFKDDVKEVAAGYECGLNINNFNDIKVGDIIEVYEIVEEKKKLEQ
ncbi:MAG: translation initiation factor IF-2 [Rhodothermaceae bacterium]